MRQAESERSEARSVSRIIPEAKRSRDKFEALHELRSAIETWEWNYPIAQMGIGTIYI